MLKLLGDSAHFALRDTCLESLYNWANAVKLYETLDVSQQSTLDKPQCVPIRRLVIHSAFRTASG